ncbi:MAG TPA: transglycosylase SLT domain-containing protein [Myxococcales bacterium]|jgi:soluble lytic murein transglycosylase|nr:transglycosylase SLT domain-containing protein [Myxococcales bacterium]
MTSTTVALSWTHALAILLALGAPAAPARDIVAPAAETPRAQSPAQEWNDGPGAAVRGPVIRETDLTPYFSSGPAKDAAAELQAGRAGRALHLLPATPTDVPTLWLRALALRAAGRSGAARRLFEALAAFGGPLADRATHLAALSAIDAGDSKLAEALLSQVSLRYVDADQALLERARLIAKLRPAGPSAARLIEQALEPIFAGSVRADLASAHLIAGDTQLAAGDKDAARAHFRAAWLEHPLSAAADTARERERLFLPPGPPVAPLSLIKRAEILVEAHRNREALDQLSRLKLPSLCAGGCPGDRTPAAFLQAALALLAPDALPRPHEVTAEDVARGVLEPADALACRAKLDQGRALRKAHEYVKSRLALAPVVLRCADPDLRARALYLLAQMETLASHPNAGPLWEALARKFPQSNLADDALYYEALARHRAGDLPSEQLLLTQLVNEHLDSDLRTEAIFRLFWSLRREGKAREGLTWLDVLAAHPDPEGAEEERARYWRARTLLETEGQDGTGEGATLEARAAAVEAARADLLWLIQERPLTYHGLLARGRLAELDPAVSQRIEDAEERAVQEGMRSTALVPLHAGALALDPHLRAGIELLRLGLKPEAARELSAVDRRPARLAGEQGREPLVLLADLTARAADARGAHQIVRVELQALLRHPVRGLSLRAASLAYPLAFRDQIAKSAQSAAIPPDLLQALMREESALDPRALSPTGAIGLTQLMPTTARAVAHKLRLGAYSTSQLLDPAINIRIGGSYLGELHAHFGHPALALAAYNAGPGAVAGWLRARGALPLDAFVEEIPLEETRGYVKRCLRSFAAYQFLYGSGSARLPHVGQTLAFR